jgi:hypothetical protein
VFHDEDLVFIDIEKGNKATWAKESGVKTTFLSLSIPAQIRKTRRRPYWKYKKRWKSTDRKRARSVSLKHETEKGYVSTRRTSW